MTFITLLLCLSIERFLHKGNLLARFNWFEQYVNKVHQLTHNQSWAQQDYVALLLVVLPVVIPVALIYGLSAFIVHGLLAFLMGAFVLFYCLGPINIYETDKVHQPIFWQSNETLFAVIFWFALLGPVAALVYRLVERSAHIHASYPALGKAASQVLSILDWLPVRLFAILFALAGNFVNTCQFWLDYLLRDLSLNRELTEKSGRIALGLEENAELSLENYPQALKLIDRSLIIFLVIVFAVTLGVLL
ncbi:transmembrane protein [Candidatus Rickettsiella viridis]|uniref:Transmembrane protein n=1 Tax=Candidatus Rickettsiella viridis TaxID=676208 RepID=A0A2Z5UUV8_9COXI|nr:regulatory signaling modulator protein AmpE [Candidatus Rickettsiella viridis]BBB15436.1 transmembrane protein [Candidatus Rickettsiella viridis]